MKNVGVRIKALRMEKGFTLPKLAEEAELSKGLLSKLENSSDSNPSLSTLYKIANALNVTVADMLNTEQAHINRVVPNAVPTWLKDLRKSIGHNLDEEILEALYVIQNRKTELSDDPKDWEFLYRSIERSLKK